MRALQKITQCGSSSHVTIPRAAMLWLGWLPGQFIIFEVLEDKSVHFRPPQPDEFAPRHPPKLVLDNTFPEIE